MHIKLMNSIGHRKNILNDTFKILGVDVDLNDEKQPWTKKIILVNVLALRLKGDVCLKVDKHDDNR